MNLFGVFRSSVASSSPVTAEKKNNDSGNVIYQRQGGKLSANKPQNVLEAGTVKVKSGSAIENLKNKGLLNPIRISMKISSHRDTNNFLRNTGQSEKPLCDEKLSLSNNSPANERNHYSSITKKIESNPDLPPRVKDKQLVGLIEEYSISQGGALPQKDNRSDTIVFLNAVKESLKDMLTDGERDFINNALNKLSLEK